jgi:hypothetical protein
MLLLHTHTHPITQSVLINRNRKTFFVLGRLAMISRADYRRYYISANCCSKIAWYLASIACLALLRNVSTDPGKCKITEQNIPATHHSPLNYITRPTLLNITCVSLACFPSRIQYQHNEIPECVQMFPSTLVCMSEGRGTIQLSNCTGLPDGRLEYCC